MPKDKTLRLFMQVSISMLCVVLLVFSVQHFFFKGVYPNVSAVETTGNLKVFWDQSCTQSVITIDWGTIMWGQTKQIMVFIRNDGNQTLYLNLKTSNWNPSYAYDSLLFSFNRTKLLVSAEEVDKIILRLYVSLVTQNIHKFSFDIIFEGLDCFPGDVNKDGAVNSKDLIVFGNAFYSQLGDSNWNPNADINGDNIVNSKDAILLGKDLGKNWT
ncbi:hypothetical protein HXY33_05390 [Candidatus Bathyarchaeota archaeon]|nr:hypothetical protein [Candidatus Bathyarchaeota archaeon]